jgi:methionyl-tRNA synthetase
VLGTLAVLLSPVMPKATERLWTAIGGDGELRAQGIRQASQWTGSGRVSALDGTLFPRIEETVTA